jgi:hypothetical protein
MKWKIFIGSVSLLFAVTAAKGETVTASSLPFVFPTQAGILSPLFQNHGAFFNYKQLPVSQGIKISWSLPSLVKSKGTLTIYTLNGKVIQRKTITNIGSLNWDVDGVGNGIYLASLTFGTKINEKIKMVLFK